MSPYNLVLKRVSSGFIIGVYHRGFSSGVLIGFSYHRLGLDTFRVAMG